MITGKYCTEISMLIFVRFQLLLIQLILLLIVLILLIQLLIIQLNNYLSKLFSPQNIKSC